jgi:hypothetical protein
MDWPALEIRIRIVLERLTSEAELFKIGTPAGANQPSQHTTPDRPAIFGVREAFKSRGPQKSIEGKSHVSRL